MRKVPLFYWRTFWAGKWRTTKQAWTEEEMQGRDPEATKVYRASEFRLLPETPEELRQAQRNTPGAGGIPPAPGEPHKMAWEKAHEVQSRNM
ncbi:hypothetical protein [Curvibacter sp. AEP1-3]|uniref:hypothetical protein n=1 Tax=Curvibacter sp. AEP1-3 TaxID=1844971 RepID=UPI000B3C69CD|nr:hypothetical protein [Curvibacter sp. AEP1-3]